MKNNKLPEDLIRNCSHYPYGKVLAYACEQCIKNWGRIASIEEMERVLEILKKENKAIASERVESVLKLQKRIRNKK